VSDAQSDGMTETINHLRLPAEPSSAGAARRFVAAALGGSAGPIEDLAVLLVSELASNAVLHARTDFDVCVRVRSDGFRVEVEDGSPVMPTLKHYVAESVTGRGLHMVAASADRWGFESTHTGKVVWFEMSRESEQ
jgi:anti-sigma regulatory factor (Ser/Thr protein kinase)